MALWLSRNVGLDRSFGRAIYKMLTLHIPSSVLLSTSMSAFKYFFDIQQVMPTLRNPLATDPVRVLAQMWVTAPFYAGLGYSLGEIAWNHQLLAALFKLGKHQTQTTT
jgi:hypothetical protein